MGRWSKVISAKEEAAIKKAMSEQKKNGRNNREVPAGNYTISVERLEIGETRDGRPMLKAMCRIMEGEYNRSCLFFNRVLYGTKNDANMILSALDWLGDLAPSDDISVTYKDMDQFEALVMDIAEDIDGLMYEVEYDPDEFNSINIIDVIE